MTFEQVGKGRQFQKILTLHLKLFRFTPPPLPGRQVGRQAGRQIDRQTDRKRELATEKMRREESGEPHNKTSLM